MKYAVTINGDNTTGMISQSVLCENDRGIVNGLSISLINTRDAQVREALIKLGWTPPNEQRNLAGEVERLKSVLSKIESFGHGAGCGCGYTCATIAKDALLVNEQKEDG